MVSTKSGMWCLIEAVMCLAPWSVLEI
jgi:hypothetical protein